jgi:hypothetical protein
MRREGLDALRGALTCSGFHEFWNNVQIYPFFVVILGEIVVESLDLPSVK